MGNSIIPLLMILTQFVTVTLPQAQAEAAQLSAQETLATSRSTVNTASEDPWSQGAAEVMNKFTAKILSLASRAYPGLLGGRIPSIKQS